MTKQECAVIMTFTGVAMLTGDDLKYFYAYCEKLLGRKVYTHEIAMCADELRDKSREDFERICKTAVDGNALPYAVKMQIMNRFEKVE